MTRTGIGYDSHRFGPGSALRLGGVTIPFDKALTGHSDGDAVAHAVTDAVLGAAAAGDIGHHFPDTDPIWEGADSTTLLARVVVMADEQGYAALNADCTVVADTPRLAPYTDAMTARLSEVLGAPVSVKASRAEGLGALGRAEGIACFATVLMGPVPA